MQSPHYRPEIDGLRAVAILIVIVFHAFPEWLPGGFIGVDIFFVISGYLITSIISAELARGGFSFTTFYGRRIRRIFPALLVVLIACFAAGWYVMLADEFVALTRHIAAGAGFLSNLQLWSEAGYFDRAAETKPLQHLWSLGIEEQFYIVWPLWLTMAFKRRLPLFGVTGVLLAASFLGNVLVVQNDQVATFYSPLTRIWELACGGLLASAMRRPNPPLRPGYANAFAFAGAALIGGALLALDQTKAFPGWWAVLPVAGTSFMIAAKSAVLNRFVLATRPMVFIGLISYPLYLWHWPILTFSRLIYPGVLGAFPRGAALIAAVVAAAATYLIVEKPIRRGALSKPVAAALFASVMVVGVAGFAASVFWWPPRLSNSGLTQIVNAVHDWNYPTPGFRGFHHNGLRYYRKNSSLTSVTAFVGDSNMEQYAPRIDFVIRREPQAANSALFITRGGCLPIPIVYETAEWVCRAKMQALSELAVDPSVEAMVFGAEWSVIGGQPDPRQVVRSLKEFMARWSASKRVYLLLGMPEGTAFDPRSMFEGSRLTQLRIRQADAEVDLAEIIRQPLPVRQWLIDAARESGAVVIDPLATLCPEGRCPTRAPNADPFYLDHNHMRPFYVIERADFLDQTLRPRQR
jgi:peptidoglycan/LPS O-acetylase OafA/YrhL